MQFTNRMVNKMEKTVTNIKELRLLQEKKCYEQYLKILNEEYETTKKRLKDVEKELERITCQ